MKLQTAHIRKNYLWVILLILFTFTFFFRLDYNTLGSWDEGWYAAISRNIARSGDWLNLVWNGKPYLDHPPLGFWLMAASYILFGISEFTTRLPSVLAGLATIILIYKIGSELFKEKRVGFVAALILGTSVWYLIRVRSGNLDALFVFFYTLVFYLGMKTEKDVRLFPLLGLSFGALVLTKTLVGFSAIAIIIFFTYRHFFIKNIAKNLPYFISTLIFFFFLVLPWYITQKNTHQNFFEYHFVNIGTRNKTLASYFNLMLEKPFFYIHMGVRKWYYLWGLATAYILISFKFIKKQYLALLLWTFVVLYPFLTSEKTELWHLIPVYAPLSLLTAGGLYDLGNTIVLLFKKLPFSKVRPLSQLTKPQFISLIYISGFIILAFIQYKTFYPEVFPQAKWISDDVAISKASKKYKERVILDDDYVPLAVFYSDRQIYPLNNLTSYGISSDIHNLTDLFKSDVDNFVAITRNWAVDNLKNEKISYRLLEKNNSFSIVTKP